MNILNEGLRGGDLEDLVLPLISVDEYESKIDENALVIAFYVSEKAAADDLNRFIQRSPVSVVDTDISPAPDQHGYFMVFVELLQNDQTATQLAHILGDVGELASISAWKMHVRGRKDLVPFSPSTIGSIIEPIRSESALKEGIMAYLSPSILTEADFADGKLTLCKGNQVMEFDFVALAPTEKALRENSLLNEPVDHDLDSISRGKAIRGILGEEWDVSAIGSHFFHVKHQSSDNCLLVRRSH